MSLRSNFHMEPKLASAGVWVEYPDCPNKDGSIPAFLISSMTRHNKKYGLAFRRATENCPVGENGVLDTSDLPDDEAEAMLANVFVEGVLLDWRNFVPKDDGKKKKYSKKAAHDIFTSEAWLTLYTDLSAKASKVATFNVKKLEADAKN